jgi:transcriptional regulator with XRE-family HTH domain
MEDIRVGAAVRAVRKRRGWRQQDVATRAGVSRSFISLVEHGHLDRVPLRTIRRIAAVLDIRIDIVARWRGGELTGLARHSAGRGSGHALLDCRLALHRRPVLDGERIIHSCFHEPLGRSWSSS